MDVDKSLSDESELLNNSTRLLNRRSYSLSRENGYQFEPRGIQPVKYDPKQDRTIKIRKKFSKKRLVFRHMMKEQASHHDKRRNMIRKNYEKLLNFSDPNGVFEKIRQNKRDKYLDDMNNGILGR